MELAHIGVAKSGLSEMATHDPVQGEAFLFLGASLY